MNHQRAARQVFAAQSQVDTRERYNRASRVSSVLADISYTLNEGNFTSALQSKVCIGSVSIVEDKENLTVLLRQPMALNSSKPQNAISAEALSNNWKIGLETAKRTVDVTAQCGVRSVEHSSITRQYRTNDRMLRYNRLNCNLFSDTMFSTVMSRCHFTCAQVYTNKFEWTQLYPMKSKKDAHETLSALFVESGVPQVLITDDAPELVKDEFRRKALEAGCQTKVCEPYSPWQNRAEGSIRELKRGIRKDMLSESSPKKAWDCCGIRHAPSVDPAPMTFMH
jgi:hypothetical protein